jgi:penicillin-binding protein 1A
LAHYFARIARQAGIVALFLVTALLGILSGVFFAYAGDLPEISALDDYTPSTITRVYGSRGEMVGDFATQRRVIIAYDDMAPHLRDAIVSAEDADFHRHFGLSIPAIAARLAGDVLMAVRDWAAGRRTRPAGASTITQQLARNVLPETVGFRVGDVSLERKIREALVAIQIEKRYTKREILTLYANQMYLGSGAYGVEAASQLYFGKHAKDVSLEEAALIAGIFQSPSRQSPYVSIERATARRAYVLRRMAEEGYITKARADEAMATPIEVVPERPGHDTLAPYFIEEVRKKLEAQYGAKQLYENGLSVQTALDVPLQRAAVRALDDGLRRIDKLHGFRAPKRNVIAEKHDLAAFRHPRWDRPIAKDDIVPAVVTGADATAIQVRAGRYTGTIDRSGLAWTGRRPASQLVKRGDLIEVRILTLTGQTVTAALEQPPLVEGAVLAIENRTGHVKAMIGGYNFDRSKFNRAVQAMRQVGSAFKPFVYTAAIDRGYTPASIIVDEAVSYPAGPNQPNYEPLNYDRTFEGAITLRRALEQSRNIPAIKMMDRLGPAEVIGYARRLGLQSPIPPYLPVAIGAAEATLLEMTSAYSVYPNQGVRMKPIDILKVTDREGNVLEENRPEAGDAIRADTAFVMCALLRGVVQRGTATRAAALNWPLGGKTGTTDDYTDAWFIGFDPDITIGVWLGYDQKKTLGHGMTGTDAALPIWIEIMKAWIGDRKDPPTFEPPGNIVFVPVDRHTGVPVETGSPLAIAEAFISGTQPGGIR